MKKPDESKQYYVDITDEEGNIITLLVEENTYYPENADMRVLPADAGGQTLGTVKTVTTKIANGQLTGLGFVGSAVRQSTLKTIGKMAGKVAVKSVGSSIAGGVGTIAFISGLVGSMNAIVGNSGFKVTMKFTWTHFQHKKL